jgi:hypothetical protein
MVISPTVQRDEIGQNARASYQTKAQNCHVYHQYLEELREILRFDRGLFMSHHAITGRPLAELAYGMYKQNVLH